MSSGNGRPAHRDVVVIGGSHGSIQALREILSRLPSSFPAAVLVVVHTTADRESALAQVLSSIGPLPAYAAQESESIRHGEIYVAIPDHHLLVRDDRLLLRRGPRENYVRPSVDALFRSAAVAYGGRVVSVVLSGEGSDGTAGMAAVRRCGGIGLVQLPALSESMPAQALDIAKAEEALPAARIAAALERRVAEAPGPTPEITPDLVHQVRVASQEVSAMNGHVVPTALTCPSCEGPLWELEVEGRLQYRCEIGHSFEPGEIAANHRVAAESALWTAVRLNEERARFNRRLARHAREQGRLRSASGFESRVDEYETQADVLRRLILATFEPGAEVPGRGSARE